MNESGVKCEQRRRVEAETLLPVGKQVAEKHLDVGGQPPDNGGTLGQVNGHGDRPLAPVVGLERRILLYDPGCLSWLA